MNVQSNNAIRFTAWTAIIGGLVAYTTVGLSLAVAGSDMEMVFHGASMLRLPTETRDLFRWWMLADVFGFYLPFIVIGGYFLHTFRDELGALGNMVALAVGFYVISGITGAVFQMATLHPLAQIYAGGDDATKVAAATVWTAIAHATQYGLWCIEGPAVFFWTPIAARLLKAAGFGGTILLRIVGWSFGLFFLFGFFSGLHALSSACEAVFALVLPLWMLLFGRQLFRIAPTHAVPNPGLVA